MNDVICAILFIYFGMDVTIYVTVVNSQTPLTSGYIILHDAVRLWLLQQVRVATRVRWGSVAPAPSPLALPIYSSHNSTVLYQIK